MSALQKVMTVIVRAPYCQDTFVTLMRTDFYDNPLLKRLGIVRNSFVTLIKKCIIMEGNS